MIVSVVSQGQEVDRRDCRIVRLDDGATAAVWRGLAYPLRDGDMIDADGPAFVPGADQSPPADRSAPAEGQPTAFAIVPGEDTSYLLIAGDLADRDRAAAALREAGAAVVRAGRYFGEPLDDFTPDWFVRFSPDGGAPSALFDAVSAALHATPRAADAGLPLRLRLLTVELAESRARAARLSSEVARLRVARAEAEAARDAADFHTRTAVAREQQALKEALAAELKAEEAAAASAAAVETRPVPASMPRRLHTEVETVFSVLLPHVRPLRDSLAVAAVEYRARSALYRSLVEIAPDAARLPGNWKKLQGLESWWERHVSDGDSDAGRLYVRLDRASRRFDLLVSSKGSQANDLAWLRGR